MQGRVPGFDDPVREHALEVCGVVRGEHGGVARQVVVPQPRDPEAQCRGAHQRRHQPALARAELAHRVVGGDEGDGALFDQAAAFQVGAPVVEADGDVEQEGVDAGEIEVEEAGELVAFEHHVVAEQVGVDGAARQCRIGGRGTQLLLEGELALDQLAQLGR